MSKENLSDDWDYSKRVDNARINLIDAMKQMDVEATGGGYSALTEKTVREAIEVCESLVDEWVEKNSFNGESKMHTLPSVEEEA